MYARITRTNLGTIDNDAKSCFNQILCNIAMLVSRYNGIPINFCKIQSTTLRNTRFKLRTALGDSTEYYQHTNKNPINGTRQGSCASPAIWLLLSSLLIKILKEKANGMCMSDVIGHINIVKEIIEGFIDDTSIFTNDSTDNLKLLLEKLQQDGTIWAKLLEASGGQLEISKCFYYLLSWKWDTKGNPVPNTLQEQQNVLHSEGIKLGEHDKILRPKRGRAESQDSWYI
jgi:hypothetical protein